MVYTDKVRIHILPALLERLGKSKREFELVRLVKRMIVVLLGHSLLSVIGHVEFLFCDNCVPRVRNGTFSLDCIQDDVLVQLHLDLSYCDPLFQGNQLEISSGLGSEYEVGLRYCDLVRQLVRPHIFVGLAFLLD